MNSIVPYRRRRKISVYILIGCCVFALLFGPWRSARRERQKALDVFYGDMDIAYDLEVRRQQAYNMVTVADSYPGTDPALTEAVLALRRDMKGEDSIARLYEENDRLTAACCRLESALRQQPLTDRDEKSLDGIAAQLDSCNLTMAHSRYNQLAEEFNSRVMHSPGAGLLVRLLGVKKLELFA